MSKNNLSNSEKRRINEQGKVNIKIKDIYNFPSLGISVEASSLEEATSKMEKELLKTKEKNND